MNAHLHFHEKKYTVNFSNPYDISIPIQDGILNPTCYGADPIAFETIRAENFVGSVREGGVVNHKKIHLSPHGNGTHTECYGHIVDSADTINTCLTDFHFVAELITVAPKPTATGDLIITLDALQEKIQKEIPEALVVRTLPNSNEKKTKNYTGTNPPYFEKEALAWMAQSGIKHLLTDLPSVDKEIDGGILAAHHAFWDTAGMLRKNATITELVFIDTKIEDGRYLLNLQIISLQLDASPSKPILYKLTEVL